MPFQVIQQTFVDRKEPIFLISVSDNQFFICNFGFVPIALNAVTLGNPSGHTFEWELVQFTGNMLIPNPDMTTGSIFGAGDGVLQVPPYTFNYTMSLVLQDFLVFLVQLTCTGNSSLIEEHRKSSD